MSFPLILLKSVLLVIFLGLSAFFSGSETALFSLDTIKTKRLTQGGKSSSSALKLLDNPLRCLTAILAGNTLVNIAVAAILTSLLIDLWGGAGLSISIVLTTLIILAFGEVTPKTIAIYNNEKIVSFIAGPLYFFNRMISPFLFLATTICDRIIFFFRLNPKKEATLTEEEFRTVLEVGQRHGVVGKSEKELVVSILELTATTAQEIMTPRTDIKAVADHMEMSRVRTYVQEVRHSKIPVYKGSLDNVVGAVYTKDLFLENERPLAEFIRPLMFVPATKKISELIRDFYRQGSKMAVVVDEYGGTSGVVTLQDVLEEIFGEIHEGPKSHEQEIETIGVDVYRINGKTSVDKVNDVCGLHIPSGQYETIAGYLLDIFGKIPAEGERTSIPEGIFMVEKMAGRRIKTVKLERV